MRNILIGILTILTFGFSIINEPISATTDILTGATSQTYTSLLDVTTGASIYNGSDDHEDDDHEDDHDEDEHEDDERDDD